jgi:BolA protein
MDRARRIEARLRHAFAPQHLRVEDESARHVGHAGAASGGGHFRVLIVSQSFQGQDPITRHRAVHAALGSAMQSAIHALALRTLTPEEWARETRGHVGGGAGGGT